MLLEIGLVGRQLETDIIRGKFRGGMKVLSGPWFNFKLIFQKEINRTIWSSSRETFIVENNGTKFIHDTNWNNKKKLSILHNQ